MLVPDKKKIASKYYIKAHIVASENQIQMNSQNHHSTVPAVIFHVQVKLKKLANESSVKRNMHIIPLKIVQLFDKGTKHMDCQGLCHSTAHG